MIITGSEKKQSKIILTTSQVNIFYYLSLVVILEIKLNLLHPLQAFQIANLIREYMEVMLVPIVGDPAQLGVPETESAAELQRKNQRLSGGATLNQRPGVILGPNC